MGVIFIGSLELPLGFECVETADKFYLYHGTEFIACFSVLTSTELIETFMKKWIANHEER